jgi:F-type H+-transporting ATPase subunit gamma
MPVLTLRELKTKIRAAQKTQQITKTMQMVAASRLKKSEEKLRQSKPYFESMEMILSHLLQSDEDFTHPFFLPREVKNIALVVITSDRGLAGSYNANVIAHAEAFLNQPRPQAVKLVLIGKKGYDYFKKREWPILFKYLDISGKIDFQKISAITQQLVEAYLSGEVDEIDVIFSSYISAMSTKPVLKKFLNLQQEGGKGAAPSTVDFILEPNFQEILNQFLTQHISSRMYLAMVEASTAENSSRMVAMKTATDNAKELIDRLSLMRNKARQAAITKEILEIVTAGEALKG